MRVYNKKDVRTMEGKVYIGRPSIFGNPYTITSHQNRELVIQKYQEYIWNAPRVLSRLSELRGKDLVCHCKPKACHGDVLMKMVQLDIDGKIDHNKPHRLGIVGCKSYKNEKQFEKYLELTIEKLSINFDMIVSGGAPGTDTMAVEYAKRNKIEYIEYPAKWTQYGNSAGMLRNTTIVEQSTIILAFWDYRSSGTYDTINKATWFNKELHKIDIRKLK